ncbi:glucose/galactose MFS transporter [Rheinheimera sp. SA_1]|uniref:sugar MFS transporter n=1 Tax=Rheinheimera sp. SA_1 TaxID=1827365 RepID=UPI0007FC1F67|nr:sugar MFS transporter [Rheinheimera sp. SA_1]OBP16524.1 glucose/galactose MFS transporter [Rheinheimera sp. SA_1]
MSIISQGGSQPAVTGAPNISGSGDQSNHFAFAAMTSLFFIWGFITALNDILIPQLKAAFSLNYTQAMLVQFCFFGAYFLVSPLAGKLIERIGYIKGIMVGLATIALGCLLFYPAAEISVYALFLFGLFILASGVTILQVSANPYVAILGEEETAASRLSLAQAINSLGHTLAPLFGAALIFSATADLSASAEVAGQTADAKSVQLPYLILAGVTLLTAAGFYFLKLPLLTPPVAAASPTQQLLTAESSIWQQKGLLLGVLAIFLYVGAEVSIGSFLVNYLALEHIGGLSEKQASTMVAYYWGGAMIGRFIGALLTRYISASYVLLSNALIAILLLFVTMNSTGMVAVWSVIAIGFFNSIMFPTIFTMAIRGLGPLTSRGSGLLCQAIVGGAILPLLQGLVADSVGVQLSFIVPVLAYGYIAGYAWYSTRQQHRVSALSQVSL